ncbi:XRE family transcriptional regulator [Erwinia pyri]|uniref:XRE family transcriptional regulator n=1 Tax=Erwinia pyri TaxID=3062598 RepID=A0AA50HP44_9GAMM|nr:XRE family transcriptional regulator [Erwinia sp. DE2]WLS80871.1 XRE family transcriptional regulator [Erwinia sp. DE2]
MRGDSIEAPPASASIERLFRVFTVLGVEMVLSSGPRVVFSMSSSTIEETEKQTDSPARREKW